MRQLVLVADRAGVDEPSDVLIEREPPETLTKEFSGSLDPQTTCEFGGVSPLDDVRLKGRRHE